jgi:Glycosyl hydrolases family 28
MPPLNDMQRPVFHAARRWSRGALLLCFLLAGARLSAETRVEWYPFSGTARETRLAVTVNGKPLPLAGNRIFHSDSSGENFAEVAVARLAADGPLQISVNCGETRLGRAALRTAGRDLSLVRSEGALAFGLPGPGRYYLQLPALARRGCTFTVALWIDDLRRLEQERSELERADAINVARKGIRPDAALDQTSAIQKLLDQGGVLLFPPGIYRTGTLRLHSNTTLYLSGGAVLRGLDRENALGSEFLLIENARNVRVCGPGTIDAASLAVRRKHNVHNVNINGSRDVAFEDVLFTESNSWGIHICKSDRFTARNVKVFSGKDGFDPDASRDVLIDGAFVVSGDDAVAVKNRFGGAAGDTERIVVRNSIVCSIKSALKIGTETRGAIRDVTFENCDVFDGERGIVLYGRDGGPIERAVWRNIRLFMIDWPEEKESGTVFHFIVDRRGGATPVRDCRVENVEANWIYRSEFAGLPDAPLEGVVIRNLRLKVDSPKSGRPALFVCRDHVRLPIENLSVDWRKNEGKWSGLVEGGGLVLPGISPAARPGAKPRNQTPAS